MKTIFCGRFFWIFLYNHMWQSDPAPCLHPSYCRRPYVKQPVSGIFTILLNLHLINNNSFSTRGNSSRLSQYMMMKLPSSHGWKFRKETRSSVKLKVRHCTQQIAERIIYQIEKLCLFPFFFFGLVLSKLLSPFNQFCNNPGFVPSKVSQDTPISLFFLNLISCNSSSSWNQGEQ